MANILITEELDEISTLLKMMSKSGSFKNISFGTIEIYDGNGDPLGYVFMGDNAEYGFSAEKPED